jgi:hypothetical protein
VDERIQAQVMPMAMQTPYPVCTSKEKNKSSIKSTIVVKLVRNMGMSNDINVWVIAFFLSLNNRNFLKNFVMTWTPSELAIVRQDNRHRGIDQTEYKSI